MNRLFPLGLAAPVVAAAALAAGPAVGADYTRGRALYENRCNDCHSESVHGREKRVAKDFDEVRGWVERWNRTLRAGWGEGEVNDVAVYLNATYYSYPCPPDVCKVVSLGPAAAKPPAS